MVEQALQSGYKQTEVGLIPKDWKVVKLSEIGTFKKGKGLKKDELTTEGFPCIRYGEIYTHHNYIIKHFFSFIPSELKNQSQKIMNGDLLFTGSGETPEEIGKCIAFLGNEEVYAGGDVIIFTPRNANSTYLTYLMYHSSIIKQKANMAQGDAIVHIYPKHLGQIVFPIPPTTEEQNAIAQVLSDTDEFIQWLDRLIEKKMLIKQAAMQELLTGRKRLPGFKGQFEIKRLDEISIIYRGASPRPIENPKWFDENSNVGWVRISDVTKSSKYLFNTTQQLSDEGVKNSRFISRNSLIMSICATVGRPIITKISVCIHDGFVVFEKPHTDIEYLYYLLTKIEKKWARHGQTGSQMNLNTTIIGNEKIMLPPTKEEQSAIAQILSDIDLEIEALEQKRDKYRQLKVGIMQQLLTGRIRLKWKS